jgi:hypothetical protein
LQSAYVHLTRRRGSSVAGILTSFVRLFEVGRANFVGYDLGLSSKC